VTAVRALFGPTGKLLRAETTVALTAAPEGAWPWGNAHHFGDHTYVGFTNNAGGVSLAIVPDADPDSVTISDLEADGFWSPADQHNAPALWQRSDGRLLAIHVGHQSTHVYQRVTVNTLGADPLIAGGWAARTDLDSQLGGNTYTYPDLHPFGAAGGVLLFLRNDNAGTSYWSIATSSDDGASWSALTTLFSGVRAYGRSHRSSSTRLDVLAINGSYAEDFADLFHFYVESGSPFKTDGTAIGGGFPVAFANMTQVYDGASAGVRAPADIKKVGDDLAAVWFVQTGTPSGHIGEDEDYLYGRSNAGGAWAVSTVAADIGALTFEFTEGGLVIDPLNLARLLVSRREVSDLGSPFRMFDVKSPDDGATWPAGIPISVDDGEAAMYPAMVRGAPDPAAVRGVWLQGPTYTSQNDFSTGIRATGRR